jgi:hypothetical protein
MEEEWKPYKGIYEKIYYDIKMCDGTVHETCWPNAGYFHPFEGEMVSGGKVGWIRPTQKHPLNYKVGEENGNN